MLSKMYFRLLSALPVHLLKILDTALERGQVFLFCKTSLDSMVKAPQMNLFRMCVILALSAGWGVGQTGIAQSEKDIEAIGDPAVWSEWRTGPIPFPTMIRPRVPETLEGGPAVDFGKSGADLAIILPDADEGGVSRKALETVAGWFVRIAPKCVVSQVSQLSGEAQQRHWLLLGTVSGNVEAQSVLGDGAANFMKPVTAGGYHIAMVERQAAPGKKAILAMGADAQGAWRAALVAYFSFHKTGSTLEGWPVRLPSNPFWTPYEATCCGDTVAKPPVVHTMSRPRIPFGVRTWGSPTPTLATYERIIAALAPHGINTIVLTPGGWQDLPGAGEICRRAIDVAYRAGIYTVLYVGNDEKAHLPAPLTSRHKDMVMAVKDHPGLLSWQLYNQLTDQLSEGQRTMLREQVEWLRGVSNKPVGMEIVWGHNTGPAPAGKAKLIRDLQSWGVNEFHHDYAPIGGWSKDHHLALWEERLAWFRQVNVSPWAVLQGHTPFVEPAQPTRAEVRNQFWWCAAAGAGGFLFEAAYIFNRFSNRGLLTWGLEPVPDGRLEEIGELSGVTRNLEEMLLTSQPATDNAGMRMSKGAEHVALRMRRSADGVAYAMLINSDLVAPASAELSLSQDWKVVEVAPGRVMRARRSPETVTLDLPAGGGVCLRLTRK
jgi:hypothetical protein